MFIQLFLLYLSLYWCFQVAQHMNQLVKTEDDDNDPDKKNNIVFNATSEFCRTLGDIPTYGLSGNREDQEDIMVRTIPTLSHLSYIVSLAGIKWLICLGHTGLWKGQWERRRWTVRLWYGWQRGLEHRQPGWGESPDRCEFCSPHWQQFSWTVKPSL